jgi:hypothetical protein
VLVEDLDWSMHKWQKRIDPLFTFVVNCVKYFGDVKAGVYADACYFRHPADIKLPSLVPHWCLIGACCDTSTYATHHTVLSSFNSTSTLHELSTIIPKPICPETV